MHSQPQFPNAEDLVEIDACFEAPKFVRGDWVEVLTKPPGYSKCGLHIGRVCEDEGKAVRLAENGKIIKFMTRERLKQIDDRSKREYETHYSYIAHCGHSESFTNRRKSLRIWRMGEPGLEKTARSRKEGDVKLSFITPEKTPLGEYSGGGEELLFDLRCRPYELVSELKDEVLLWIQKTKTYAQSHTRLKDAVDEDNTGIIIVFLKSFLRIGSRVLLVGPGARSLGRYLVAKLSLISDVDESSLISGSSGSECFILYFPFELARTFIQAETLIHRELKTSFDETLDFIKTAMKWQRLKITVCKDGRTLELRGASARKLSKVIIEENTGFSAVENMSVQFPHASGSMPPFKNGTDVSNEHSSITRAVPIFLGYLKLVRTALEVANISEKIVSYKDTRPDELRKMDDKKSKDYCEVMYARRLADVKEQEKLWDRNFEIDFKSEEWPIREEGPGGRDPHGQPFSCLPTQIAVYATDSKKCIELMALVHYIVEVSVLPVLKYIRHVPQSGGCNIECTPRNAVAQSYTSFQNIRGLDVNRTPWTPKVFELTDAEAERIKAQLEAEGGMTKEEIEVEVKQRRESLLRKKLIARSRMDLFDPRRVCSQLRGKVALRENEEFGIARITLREAGQPLIIHEDFVRKKEGKQILSGKGPLAGLKNLVNLHDENESVVQDPHPYMEFEYGIKEMTGKIYTRSLERVWVPTFDEDLLLEVQRRQDLRQRLKRNFLAGSAHERFQSVVSLERGMIKRGRDPLPICANALREVHALHQVPDSEFVPALRKLSTLLHTKVSRCGGCKGCVNALNEILPGLANLYMEPDKLVFTLSTEYVPIEKEGKLPSEDRKDQLECDVVGHEEEEYEAEYEQIVALQRTGLASDLADKAVQLYRLGHADACKVYMSHSDETAKNVISAIIDTDRKLFDEEDFQKFLPLARLYHAENMYRAVDRTVFQKHLFKEDIKAEKNKASANYILHRFHHNYMLWGKQAVVNIAAHAPGKEQLQTLQTLMMYFADSNAKEVQKILKVPAVVLARGHEIFAKSRKERLKLSEAVLPFHSRLADEFADIFAYFSNIFSFDEAITKTLMLWGKPVSDLVMPRNAHNWTKVEKYYWDHKNWGLSNIRSFVEESGELSTREEMAESINLLFEYVFKSAKDYRLPREVVDKAREYKGNFEELKKFLKTHQTHADANGTDIEDAHLHIMKKRRQERMLNAEERSAERKAEIRQKNGIISLQAEIDEENQKKRQLSEGRQRSWDVLFTEHAQRERAGQILELLIQQERLGQVLTIPSMQDVTAIRQGTQGSLICEMQGNQPIWDDRYAKIFSEKHTLEEIRDAVCTGAAVRDSRTGNNLHCRNRFARR